MTTTVKLAECVARSHAWCLGGAFCTS